MTTPAPRSDSDERAVRDAIRDEYQHLEAFYAALTQCYEAITLGASQDALFETVCRSLVEAGGMSMAWVGMASATEPRVVPVASHGDAMGYLADIVISTDPGDPRAHGPTGTAFRTGQPVWLDDFQRDVSTKPWQARALATGWHSSAAVPLLCDGETVGALTIYATTPRLFSVALRRLVMDLARGVGLGLERLNAQARMRLEGAALAAAADAIVIGDAEGRITSVNTAFTTITGYTEADAIGRSLTALLDSGQNEPAVLDALWRQVRTGHTWRGTLLNRRKDGALYTEESTVTPVRDARGVISHVVAVKQDVTERRQLEEQFRQAQKVESIGLLAGGIAHDFNNMLGVIIGRAELALDSCASDSPTQEDLQEILTAAQRSAELTRRLLTFARKEPISPRAVNLSTAVDASTRLLQRLLGEEITLERELTADVWPVWIDPSQVDQLLANLCVNARDAIRIQAMAESPGDAPARHHYIRITTANRTISAAEARAIPEATPGDYVLLSVRDTGCGMTDAVRARIFEPFFSTKPAGEGTGLGLSTVFGAVRQNQGFITVRSRVGEGTVMTIGLPRLRATAGEPAGASESDLPTGTETVLLVEDEPTVLHLAAAMLRRLGYTVLEAAGVETARDLASRAGRIDLLLADLMFPDGNGVSLSHALLGDRPGLRVLFMSGYSPDALPKSIVLPACCGLVHKPFTMTEFALAIRACLDQPSAA